MVEQQFAFICVVALSILKFWYEAKLPHNAVTVLAIFCAYVFLHPYSEPSPNPLKHPIFLEEQILEAGLVLGNLQVGSLREGILGVLLSYVSACDSFQCGRGVLPPRPPNGGAPGNPPKGGGPPTPAAGP